MQKLAIYESVCDCEKCSLMCRYPCCGTVKEMKAIINAGYGDRLMLDDFFDGSEVEVTDQLKPALKGHEGDIAPWETGTQEGCTFWKNGLCELHDKGLKPLGARIAHHEQKKEVYDKFKTLMEKEWDKNSAKNLIEKWKEEFLFPYDDED